MYFHTELFTKCIDRYFYLDLEQTQQHKDQFASELYRQISLQNKHLSEGEIQNRVDNFVVEACTGINFCMIQLHARYDMLNSEALGFVNTIWVKSLLDYMQTLD